MLRFADKNFVVQPNIIMSSRYGLNLFFLYCFLKRGISTNFAAVDFAFD